VAKDLRRWEVVLEQLQAGAMPPEKAKQHPKAELRQEVIGWVRALRQHEAARTTGDLPPRARRLSNAEYDYTVRDLTGVDLRPANEFPVDPANEAGFDNSGESLAMSPALVKKYLEAARRAAEHLVLKPHGFAFAAHPVVTDTDRDKYAVRRIIDFYKRQRTDYADYFQAAWRYRHRAALGKSDASLADIAAEGGVSAKYLATVWATLTESAEDIGPIAALQALWRELPAPNGGQPDAVRAGCERMRDFIVRLRQKLNPTVNNLAIRGIAAGSQPLVLWKNRQYAANRMRYAGGALKTLSDPKLRRELTSSDLGDRALVIPDDEAARARYEQAFERFCAIFPDAFYVSERVRVFLKEDKESEGRLLSAGFHLMVGYFRDDAPLAKLILDEPGHRELDALWREFDFVTLAPVRQYKDFVFFERAEPPRFMGGAEFDFARSEDKDVTSEAKIKQLAEAYLAKARRNGGEGPAITAIEDYFRNISAEIRSVELAHQTAEPSHREALLAFAERAYRRPLTPAERNDLLTFYRALRERDGLGHEDAIRDTIASVLVSPHFCYRVEPQTAGSGAPTPPDYALASRLSYFLWASMPDAELLARAAAGDLHRPEVLAAQARRMLQDGRARGLATEFAGHWLDFRRFEEHNSVDRERFPSFTNELRQAMFEEPVRFFLDLVRADRPVLDFLYAKHTFVNPVLAKHYGMPDPNARPDEWVRVEDADQYGRGGLLPMAVFQTLNAPGLRTSPVKRGYWVVRRLLGEHIPAPPAEVPELPADEAKLGELTLREALARHRQDKACAGCHERFDPIGLAFEGYGPVGERRAKDLGGRPVDTRATFPGGGEGNGVEGLRAYLRERRQDEFVENLCRKLLAYALGRSLRPADDETVRAIRTKLATDGYRFGPLIEAIVTSPQFLGLRGSGEPAKDPR
jgi:hypothetical protein